MFHFEHIKISFIDSNLDMQSVKNFEKSQRESSIKPESTFGSIVNEIARKECIVVNLKLEPDKLCSEISKCTGIPVNVEILRAVNHFIGELKKNDISLDEDEKNKGGG
jgi:hypothetical protein